MIHDRNPLSHELVTDVFEQVTQQVSFAKKWGKKFFDFQNYLDRYKTVRPEYQNANPRAQETFTDGFEKSWVL